MSTPCDNLMVWDRRTAGHYEVWFATFNDPTTGAGFWIRYTIESPVPGRGGARCQMWFAYFNPSLPSENVAFNRAYPLSALHTENDLFRVQIADCELGHDFLSGTLSGDGHAVAWDLRFTPNSFTHQHLPALVYRHDFADTVVCSPNLMVSFNGTVTVDGRVFELVDGPACQSHVYGRKHAHAWAWSHCNAFREDPTACLETLSVRLASRGLVTPPLTFISLYLGSEVHHFRDFADLLRTRGAWETGLYRVSAANRRLKIVAELRCRPEHLVQATYTDPDGDEVFCHNTEVAECSVTVWTRPSFGRRLIKLCRLTTAQSSHFEYAGRSPDRRVKRRHVPVRATTQDNVIVTSSRSSP